MDFESAFNHVCVTARAYCTKTKAMVARNSHAMGMADGMRVRVDEMIAARSRATAAGTDAAPADSREQRLVVSAFHERNNEIADRMRRSNVFGPMRDHVLRSRIKRDREAFQEGHTKGLKHAFGAQRLEDAL